REGVLQSLWLSIIWAAGHACVPRSRRYSKSRRCFCDVILWTNSTFEDSTRLELTLPVWGWLKLALDTSLAWISFSVLFSFGILLPAEKLCLQFVATNFHQKALADRLSENRLGLRALDRLSNAQPVIPGRKKAHAKRGHISLCGSVDLNHAT
ncbi:hypothetical protein C8J55DRAFT_569600, partial [Lentinula edodes]